MITIRHLATGAVQTVATLDGIDPEAWEQLAVAEPPAAGGVLVNGAWQPVPRRLTGLQILGLYTAAQHGRARRMLDARFPATFPPGHPQAGQPHPQAGELIDPNALVQRLVDATLALREPIAVTDAFHQNGTAFLRAVGVIESDAEAARILAGLPPSTSF